MTTPSTFDITAPLPGRGTTLLEASAGTGKTWTIGALVTRYVAEGVARLEEMLVITFGRAASQELRQRVREQLVEAERVLAGDGPAPVTPLLATLVPADPEERLRRHRRVREALTSFDAATIATTHQFCRLVLASLGVAGDTDARAELVEDLDDLLVEVVDDLYLRGFSRAAETPAFTYAEALAIARAAVGDPQARLEPATDPRTPAEGRKVAFARKVREELALRKRRLGVLSYDDLLSQLREALADEDAPARTRMRERWSVVLVDEFQDTDPVQWDVLDRAFTGHATMVLIGDPKQAIYAFRGGDVVTYLAAAETAGTHQTLGTNYRSDAPLVRALDRFLGGAALGDERIVVHPVEAEHDRRRLTGAPSTDPFRVRVVRSVDLAATGIAAVRDLVARDLALDVLRLLESGARWDGRALEARDVAVLAHEHRRLAEAQAALRAQGIPAVIAGQGSVFATEAAVQWLTLLEALEQPHREARLRAAALTCFLGHTAVELDAGGAALTDRLGEVVRRWSRLLATRGVAAVLEAAVAAGLAARVLGTTGGERLLTDVEHVGEVLHTVGLSERLGLVAMVTWLREHIAEGRTTRTDERTRRLDSDAAAVQLVTIHASKGLEYPVVYLPAAFDRWPREPEQPLFHDADGQRCRAVGKGRDWDTVCATAEAEELGETLRLLYVALTRAKSQVVAWWAPSAKNTRTSSLHRVLARDRDSSEVPASAAVWNDQQVVEVFAAWREAGALTPEAVQLRPVGRTGPDHDDAPLAARRFAREVDTAWRRTSYSALSHVETDSAPLASEPEVVPREDEENPAAPPPVPLEGDLPSPMADLPVGATFGSLVHAVLEHADPAAPDLRVELATHLAEQRVWWPVDVDEEALVEALVAVCDSPLGPLADGRTLRDLPLRERLRELDFELPLAGGDLGPSGPVPRLGDLAPLLRRHLPEGDPVRGYAEALDRPALGDQPLAGYLTGSVDVVLRVGSSEHPRYLVVDYKTNWLGPREEPLTAASYAPDRLVEAMAHSDYPLQALLYAVVLHRFLRWRQPGYDPEVHLGGVLYLYLRGMCGPATPLVDGRPCGVFTWRPPVALVEDLSDLLDGRVVAP